MDCTGRGGRSNAWLQELNCDTPPVQEVKADIAYATQVLRRKPGDLAEGRALASTRLPVRCPIPGSPICWSRPSPSGFAAVGDAVASFNPIYGQGMTSAIQQAQILGEALTSSGGMSVAATRAFFQAASLVISVPWRFATGADFAYPETTGARPPGQGLVNKFSFAVQRAALTDLEVRRTYAAVQHLIAPSSRLTSPLLLARVIRASAPRRMPWPA